MRRHSTEENANELRRFDRQALLFDMLYRLRRLAPLMLCGLALEFFAGASGALCNIPAAGSERGNATSVDASSMPGSMPGMPMPGDSKTPHDNGSRQAPCNIPWAPATCSATAPCAAGGMAAHALMFASAPSVESAPPALRALEPATRTIAPEPPPPKA